MKSNMHVIVYTLSLIKCSVDFHFVYKFVEIFYQPKNKNLCSGYIGTIISAVIICFIDLFDIYILNPIFMLAIVFVRCIIVLNGPWRSIVYASIIAVTIPVCEFMTLALTNVNTQLVSLGTLQIFLIGSNIIIYSFICYYFIKFFKKKLKNLYPNKYLLILPITSISSMYYILYLKQSYTNNTFFSDIAYIAVVFGLGLVNIVVLAVHDVLNKKSALEQEVNKMRTQQITNEITNKQQEYNLQKLSKVSHDFKSHLICLYGLTQSNSDIKEYISNLIDEIDSVKIQNINKSNNEALNIILYEKEQQCLKLNIIFKVEITYGNLSFISYKDICTIFANALDNAVNACCLVLDSNIEPNISLRIFRVNSMLFIKISNSKVNDIFRYGNKVVSTKNSSEAHGYGLVNIKDAVRHYNGSMDFTFTDNLFQLSLCIPLIDRYKAIAPNSSEKISMHDSLNCRTGKI